MEKNEAGVQEGIVRCPFCETVMMAQLGFFGDKLWECARCGTQITEREGMSMEITNLPLCPKCLTKVKMLASDGGVVFGCKCEDPMNKKMNEEKERGA